MFAHRSVDRARIPLEIRLELLSAQSDLMPQIRDTVLKVGAPGGDGAVWLRNRLARHADGEIMIFGARSGRLLAGFMMLEPPTMAASYSWVAERFRHKGLGQRFYSFACINLGAPSPGFVFHRDMYGECRDVLKGLAVEAHNDDAAFCAVRGSFAGRAA